MNRQNNFNLLRIYLSLSVVFFHCYELSGQSSLAFLNRFFNGETAVKAFFIISGYLVMKSYTRSASLKIFWMKRFRRIYPAYSTVIILSIMMGSIISTLSARQYFSSFELYRYLAANLMFLNFIQPTLPGVFENNLFKAVNGALWTLKIEVGYYVLVPVIVFLKDRMQKHLLYAMIFLSSLGFYIITLNLYHSGGNEKFFLLSHQLPGLLFYFISGAWVTEIETTDLFRTSTKWLGIPALLLLTFTLPVFIQSVILVVAVFFVAYRIPEVRYPFQQQDISYGLYIYHFPVIQLLIQYNIFRFSPVAGLVWSVLITIFFAILSWILIEKPFITIGTRHKFHFN